MYTFSVKHPGPLSQLLHTAQIFIGCLPNTRYTGALQDGIRWVPISNFPILLVWCFPSIFTLVLPFWLHYCAYVLGLSLWLSWQRTCLSIVQMHVDSGSIPGSGRCLERETATCSSILAWKLPWTELQSMGLQCISQIQNLRVDRKLNIYLSTTSGIHWCANPCLKFY